MFFASDNAGPVHPSVLDALATANDGYRPGYGAEVEMEAVRDRLRELGWCGNGASGHALAPGEVWTFEVWAGEISPPFRLELDAWRAQSEQPLVVRSEPLQNPVFRRDTALELLLVYVLEVQVLQRFRPVAV